MARLAGSDVERRRRSDRRASARARDAAVTPPPARQAADVAAAAQLACLLEASAPKPGNVSPFASFRDTSYEDFLASAAAIGPALALAGERSLGATIRAAVEATARWAPSNTNLGLVLLLAPLARAELRPGLGPLRARLTATLADTTVGDARDAYVAIRSAAPGGLGRASEQDVAGTPTVTLREAMALARDRDAVAREYAADFAPTFEIGAPGLHRALADRLPWRRVVVEGGLNPDAHYVLDFAELKHLMKRLTDEIDHKVLLPLENPKVQVREEGDSVRVAVGGKPRYVFPRIDCALLPVPNTTVEMLAQYLAGRVSKELAASGEVALQAVEVEVEENFGQSATYRESLG